MLPTGPRSLNLDIYILQLDRTSTLPYGCSAYDSSTPPLPRLHWDILRNLRYNYFTNLTQRLQMKPGSPIVLAQLQIQMTTITTTIQHSLDSTTYSFPTLRYLLFRHSDGYSFTKCYMDSLDFTISYDQNGTSYHQHDPHVYRR